VSSTRITRALEPLFAVIAVLSVIVASGSLECGLPRTPAVARGDRTYAVMCAVCHGERGEGYAADHAPAIAHPEFLRSATDEFLRNAIENGRSGSTMSAWSNARGGPLGKADVDALIASMRNDGLGHAKLDESPLHADATRGAAVFTRECAGCHGDKGLGGTFVQIGNPELLATASNGFLRHAILDGRSSAGMPAFESKLGQGGVEDVVAHLRALQAAAPPPKRSVGAKPPPIPLGQVPLNPRGPEPRDLRVFPATTPADTIKRELDRGAKMVLLDARAPSDYMNEHIAGASSVPFYDPDPYFSALPTDAWIVAYCACPHAESKTLATKLQAHGFAKVTVLDEGLGVWRSRKYPTRQGLEH
jgi:cytochrome c oxidase cbb3-type subunit 3/ubiquinol-cytochrome c reductase cytochrome c subunit